MDEVLDDAGCPMKTKIQLDVAVEEIFVNIAHYAYGEEGGHADITIRTPEGGNEATITFKDRGVAFDPLKKEDPDTSLAVEDREIGGLGIFMVKKSMDEVVYDRIDDQNVLTIRKSW